MKEPDQTLNSQKPISPVFMSLNITLCYIKYGNEILGMQKVDLTLTFYTLLSQLDPQEMVQDKAWWNMLEKIKICIQIDSP